MFSPLHWHFYAGIACGPAHFYGAGRRHCLVARLSWRPLAADMLGGLLAGMIGCLSAQIIWKRWGINSINVCNRGIASVLHTDPQRLGA